MKIIHQNQSNLSNKLYFSLDYNKLLIFLSTKNKNIEASAKAQLTAALEALKTNSAKLESKLDKIEDLSITPHTFYDTTRLTDDDEQMQQQNQASNSSPVTESQHHIIKKKQNDSFFNDIFNKSDTLLAQTQQKMERLSRLETVAKPLAPAIPTPATPPQPKPKPMATILVQSQNTSSSTSSTINNSKSLIDLKNSPSSSSTIVAPPSPSKAATLPQNTEKSNQVDLLFDLNNEQSFTLNTEPIAQTNSYFDLIGLDTTDFNTNGNLSENAIKSASNSNVNILQSLFNIEAAVSGTANEHVSVGGGGGADEEGLGKDDENGIQINQSNEVLQQVCFFMKIVLCKKSLFHEI